MSELERLLSDYDYRIAKKNIASVPASPRDGAKLLIYDRATGAARFDTFLHLDKYLPKNALLVFNDTKVIPARLYVARATGGRVEVLCLNYDIKNKKLTALANKRLALGEKLFLKNAAIFEVTAIREKEYELRFIARSNFSKILKRFGVTPLPPYIKHSELIEAERREKYQTVFARVPGSAAAPTASLHFTHRLLEKLKKRGFGIEFITLHVGLGTFAPLSERALRSGRLHAEHYSIAPRALTAIKRARRVERPIVPIGTTALRAIESAFADPRKARPAGETGIFIRPGYRFRCVNGLITNFHVPRSSLLMLVAALVGREKIPALYRSALRRGFKFFSFGDGMLIV
ncbi:MAG: tRNA preQ1(34) S-adenosylmethionine ribosyltransferase-isomerase QueA [Candidatus Niyogibacteria bacterium]|nr:tRNA preQ1(34) S-adenosylmethionine ribosyltransferase-isomerase QueA [Candidatus Niyogibacteria bacterium]